MKQRIRIVLPILLVSLVCVNYSSVTTPILGVCIGDYFTYEMYGIYTSNNSVAISIPNFEKNNTDWTRITITGIEHSNVSQNYTLHFRNSSELIFPLQSNLKHQSQTAFTIAGKGVPICSSNLNPGDQVPNTQITIKRTITRSFSNGIRQINYASWSSIDEWGEIHFDRVTGMLVELKRTHCFTNTMTGYMLEKTDYIRLLDTNRWVVNN